MKFNLSELVKIVNGYAFKSADIVSDQSVYVIKIKNIQSSKILLEKDSMTAEVDGLNKYQIKFNDILISLTGSGMNQMSSAVGKVGRFRHTQKAYLNQRVAKISSLDETKLTNDYLYYFLNRPEIQKDLVSVATGSANQVNISPKIIGELSIDLPDLAEQERITNMLTALDSKIEILESINDNLLELAETMFSETFPQFRSDGNTIGDYIKPKRGKNLLSKNIIEGEVPVVAGGLKPAGFHNEANTVAPVITISASGANAGFTNIWEENVWSSDSSYIDITVTQNVYFWFLMLKKRQQEIFGAQTGSAQPHIYPKHIEEMPTGNIRDNEISEFNKRIGPMFEVMGASSAEIKTLVNIRDTLIRKMLY
ncbi:restriction endonuclease subunit S [Weissella confusa]|uniref:restriction endonuclease subunit S n=1 Tax=Weissella confusa TaxID=1583 RepID=UPI0021AF96C8|nr:restriction endonuclease subunit S [Weissella confusa]MCS9989732.1 restriction endonuclease subunit S [Weissella confusa]